jgi:nucleotide-binding universal stress UspA family protein
MEYRNILCPLDGTELMAAAEDAAASLAKLVGAKLILVYVVERWYRGADVVGSSEEWKKIHDKWLKEGWDLLEKEGVKLRNAGVKDIELVLRDGEAAYEIIAAAKERNADLIVLATHGFSTIGKLFAGSVTDKVSKRAPCPLLWVIKKK